MAHFESAGTIDEHVVAFIDVGTHSARMLLVRIHPDLSFSVLSQRKETVRLGQGAYHKRTLRADAIDRVVLVCQQFVEMAHSKEAQQIIAVSTSAARQAQNRRIFQARLKAEAQLDMRIISGLEEARYIYLGVSSGFDMDSSTGIVIDIGGGSTEIIVGDQQQQHYMASLPLGHIRLSNRLLEGNMGPIHKKTYEQLKRHVRDAAVREMQIIREKWLPNINLAIGSSGTIENLTEIARRRFGAGAGAEYILSYADLEAVIEDLRKLSLHERREVPGINKQRADVILGGAAILDCLMQDLALKQIHVSKRSLRDGLLVHYLDQFQPSDTTSARSVRRDSVLRLGRALRFDETHARRVTNLALSLFDSALAVGLHAMGEWERELLEYAAWMHDIGIVLSYKGHQEHSAYFIRNADLPGFNQQEIAIMATAVRFHRKAFPQKRHAPYQDLDQQEQHVVRVIGLLLSMAESLDRSHAGLVERVELMCEDEQQALLRIYCSQDCPLEAWGVEYHTKAFKRILARKLAIEIKNPLSAS